MADWARLFNECWRWAGLGCSWDPGRGSCICICIMHTHYPLSRPSSVPFWPPLSLFARSLSFHISHVWVFFLDFIPLFYLRALPLPLETLLCSVLCHEGVMKKYIPRKAFSVHVRTRWKRRPNAFGWSLNSELKTPDSEKCINVKSRLTPNKENVGIECIHISHKIVIFQYFEWLCDWTLLNSPLKWLNQFIRIFNDFQTGTPNLNL